MIEADAALRDDWHVVAELDILRHRGELSVKLLGISIVLEMRADVINACTAGGQPLPTAICYGFVWVCPGKPSRDIVHIPEAAEAGRIVTTCSSLGIHASAGRVIENFLDMGHFPYVHDGLLGAEPETEVVSYAVDRIPEGGIIATGCRMYQPLASPAAIARQRGRVRLRGPPPVHRDPFEA